MPDQRPWYFPDSCGIYDEGITITKWYNEDWGVGDIVMRQREDEWEYAFVDWRYRTPSLDFILYNGIRTEG